MINSGASLLVVDDDDAIGITLSGILTKAGYRCNRVTTGGAAIEHARNLQGQDKPLNAAMIDIRLPDINGLEVLRGIRKMYPDAGAVMMTGYADTATAIAALNEGAYAYIQKPYNIDEIKTILERIMERQKLLTENRELLGKLQEMNAVLEGKVGQRTQELRDANLQLAHTIEKLREADAIKSEFVSMVSHELRTPLTVIIGFTETILKHIDIMAADKLKYYLNIIHSDSLRLSKLIDDILNLSAIRDRSFILSYASFNPEGVVAGVVEGFKNLRRDISFETSIERDLPEIMADKDRLKQIFFNLLGNAVKYSPEGGSIMVCVKAEGPVITVSITDQGPGIPEEERSKIFDAFYRTRDTFNKATPGTGLGLTITKAILAAHGGRIWVESGENGRGTRFIFTIPKERT